jgi:hypothetical protein
MAIKVKDEFRKNELSLEPGGSVVRVLHRNGKEMIYDKVKNPSAYCRRLTSDETVIEITVDGQPFWNRNQNQ